MKGISYKISIIVAALIGMSVLVTSDLFAQEEEGFIKRMFRRFIKKEEVKVKVEEEIEGSIEDFTEEEIVKRLTDMLGYQKEVLEFIPELQAKEDEEGNLFYTYTPQGGMARDLEGLDKETLMRIFGRVSREVNRLNTERMMRQLEQARQAQQASQVPPQPPKVYIPQKAPSPPPQPPQVYTPPMPPATAPPAQSAPPAPPNTSGPPKK